MINKILIFLTLSFVNSFNILVNRRELLESSFFSSNIIFSRNYLNLLNNDALFNISKIKELNEERKLEIKKNNPDRYSHWSIYGIIPPPIKKVLSYQELLQKIHNNSILSIQIAPQHNSIIATNFQGYRYACQVNDKKFDKLIKDSLDKNENLPFIVLPIDKNRQKLRHFSQAFLTSSIFFYILADLDIIDIDTTSYGSWKERELAYKNGQKPKKFLKSLLENITSSINNK